MRAEWSVDIVKAMMKHFIVPGIHFVYEGEVQDVDGHELWVEFRRIGPHFTQIHGQHRVTLTLDFAVMELITTSKNIFQSDKVIGELCELCEQSIEIYPDVCFYLASDVRVTPWGRVAIDSQVKQTTVEATFQTEITDAN
jgi:hypothetical protein